MKGFIKVIAVILLIFAVLNIIPPKVNVTDNPFIVGEGKLPLLAAHRGGGDNNPENTMLAFREAIATYEVDIIESDLYLTKVMRSSLTPASSRRTLWSRQRGPAATTCTTLSRLSTS